MPEFAYSNSRSHIPAISRSRIRAELIAQSNLPSSKSGFLELYYVRRYGVSSVNTVVEFLVEGEDGRPTVVPVTPGGTLKELISEMEDRIKSHIDTAFATAGGGSTSKDIVHRTAREACTMLFDMQGFWVSAQVEDHRGTALGTRWEAAAKYDMVRSNGESLWGDIPPQYVQLKR